jgi:glycosyltransferase involved in cell wall biosynthesis
VVDDGSTDDGPAIVAGIAAQDSRFCLLSQTNQGPGAARNRGVEASTGRLVAFLDADDEWHPEYLENAVVALDRHPDCAAAVCDHLRGRTGEPWTSHCKLISLAEGRWRLPLNTPPRLIKSHVDFMDSGAVVCRRSVLSALGGFYEHRCTYGEDSYLWIKLIFREPIWISRRILLTKDSEASELGRGRKGGYPPWPKLFHAADIRAVCPTGYRALLDAALDEYAAIAVGRCVKSGDLDGARRVLALYPICASNWPRFLRLRIRCLLERWRLSR